MGEIGAVEERGRLRGKGEGWGVEGGVGEYMVYMVIEKHHHEPLEISLLGGLLEE